jgi:hypothetical protein
MSILRATLLMLSATVVFAAGPARFEAARPSTVLLQGSSNLAAWRCSGTSLTAEVEIEATVDKINEVIDRVEDGNVSAWILTPEEARLPQPRFWLSIPIESLRCGNRVMEGDLRRALDAERYPAIEFRFTRIDGALHRDMDRDLYETTVLGELFVAGVRRPVKLPVVAQRISRSRFRLRAELPLRMTDFGVTPPTALFGLIKANNDLKVRFDLVLQPVAANTSLKAQGSLLDRRSGS